MKFSTFKECRELKLGFFECPSTLFIFAGFLTVLLIFTTFLIARNYYSEEVVFLLTVFIALVMLVISYFVHVGTTKVAQARRQLQSSHDQLKEALEKLKKAEQVKGDFMNMMIHDLRSPLNGIKMVSELVKEDLKKEKKSAFLEPVGLIRESAKRMLEMVNDLLDVAKIEAGMFKCEKSAGRLPDLAKDVRKYFQPLAKNRKIKLSLAGPLDIPDFAFDKKKIRQVLENLISNSLKFTEEGGGVEVGMFIHKKGRNLDEEAQASGLNWHLRGGDDKLDNYDQSLVLAVSDNGTGISFEDLSKLFNKFEQMKTSAQTGKKSTGLGLVIVKGVVEAQGGKIGVASKEGEGTTIYFNLPLANN